MANATLTITIKGTVNGKNLNYTFTQVVDNIDSTSIRLGAAESDASVLTHAATGGPNTPIVDQDSDIMLVANTDNRGTLQVMFTTSGDDVWTYLEPGAFIVMQKAALGGVVNSSTTATTTSMVSLEVIEVLRPFVYNTAAKYWIMGCYNLAS